MARSAIRRAVLAAPILKPSLSLAVSHSHPRPASRSVTVPFISAAVSCLRPSSTVEFVCFSGSPPHSGRSVLPKLEGSSPGECESPSPPKAQANPSPQCPTRRSTGPTATPTPCAPRPPVLRYSRRPPLPFQSCSSCLSLSILLPAGCSPSPLLSILQFQANEPLGDAFAVDRRRRRYGRPWPCVHGR